MALEGPGLVTMGTKYSLQVGTEYFRRRPGCVCNLPSTQQGIESFYFMWKTDLMQNLHRVYRLVSASGVCLVRSLSSLGELISCF